MGFESSTVIRQSYIVDRFEQIEQYLRGLMPAEEARAFEAEMAADPELAALVQKHRLERQGLELLVERDLFARMQAWERETTLFQQTQPLRGRVRPFAWVWRVAAVLALAVLGWWLLRDQTDSAPVEAPIVHTKPERRPRTPDIRRPAPAQHRPSLPEEGGPSDGIAEREEPAPIDELPAAGSPDYAALATEFYRERDFIPPKGAKGGTAGSASYDRAVEHFQNGRFDDVISLLKPALNLGADALQRKELLALALYNNQQYETAVPYWSEIIAAHRAPYSQRAEWAMALTLLHLQPAKQPLLNRVLSGILADPQHPFHRQALELQARLQ